MQNRRYIGIDAGATKTKAVVFNDEGQLIFETTTGHGNIIIDEQMAIYNVKKALHNCQPYFLQDNALLVGMAGIQVAGKIDFMEHLLSLSFPELSHIKVVNDGYLGMMAGLKGHDGLFVISGTGSVVYAKHGSNITRVGGLGHILGDEGSAYWIGKELFYLFGQALDAANLDESLFQSLMQKTSLSAFELVNYFYTLNKEEVAKFALFVSHEASKGDVLAIKILKSAGYELAKQVKLVMKISNLSEGCLMVLSGSVLVKNEWVRKAMLEHLPRFKVLDQEIIPSKASYYYWRKEADEC